MDHEEKTKHGRRSPNRRESANSRELIRDQQTQLHLLSEFFPAILWKALLDGRVTDVNRYGELYTGLTPEQMGADWLRLVHPDDREEVKRRSDVLVAGGQWPDHVHRFMGADGEYRWFQSRMTTNKDDSGKVVALHGLMVDAHDIVTSERSPWGMELILRNFIDSLPAMLWRADTTGRIKCWSRMTIETIGKPWDPSERFDLMSRVDPAQRADVEERWAKSVRLSVPYEDSCRILGNDGRYHWHLVRARPFRDDGGNIVSWYGVHTDIDALKEAEAALQTRERQLLGIVETVPGLLWSASPTGEPTHVNRRVREYSGMSVQDFTDLGWQAFIHPDDFEETARLFYRSIQTGEPYNTIHRLRRADGEYRWHQAMGEPLRDSEGRIIQWYGLAVDIDDSKRAEDHLRETRAKLNRASRIAMVAELSASIAHELNQPLMSVLSNAQAIQRWLAATPPNLGEAAAAIERIVRDAQAADQTMQNIRALFGREPFERREASVPEIVHESVRLVQEDLNKRGMHVECVSEGVLPMVNVDPIQIQEVFINLITNAMEAVENIPREPRITIKAEVLGGEKLAIRVIDNGPGVDDVERVFDAFVTTKDNGMGIGLAVSRSIVEAHDGQLWAENNADFGATFTLQIPLPERLAI
jgi:PAS domain S-box-containing protein